MSRLSFRNSRRRGGLLPSKGFFATLVLLAFVIVLGALRAVAPDAFIVLARPFWAAGSSLSAAAAKALPLESRSALIEERDRLAAENAAYVVQGAALAAELSDLRALLGARTEAPASILAGVLARPPVAPYDTLVVDQGADAGVEVGMRVEGVGGTPLGIVASVSAESSRIVLYSSQSMSTEAWVGPARAPLTLAGAGAGALTASVLRDAGIAVGDGVYVAVGGAVPIGTVASIGSDPSSPQVELHIRPYVNPFSTTWVSILR